MSKYAGNTSVQLRVPQRSEFDLSHTKRISARMGYLFPVLCVEALPGDSFMGSSEILVRMAPMLAPVYDEIFLYVHFFYTPNRLMWGGWEKMITGGRLGVGVDPMAAPIPPKFSITSVLTDFPELLGKSSLADYLGVPIFEDLPGYTNPAQYAGLTIDWLPFLSYQFVWFEYYRDRNFVPDDYFGTDGWKPVNDGEFLNVTYLQLRVRNYQQDYFTAALPSTQRGVEVLMPLAGSGSVTYLDVTQARWGDGSVAPDAGAIDLATGGAGYRNINDASDHALRFENIDEVLLDASSVSINDFRGAYALQVWLERNEVAGSRYFESNYAHFYVRTPDARLQRPEYIGGGRIPVRITEIVSTAYSSDGEATVPLANLAGHGLVYGNTNSFRYFSQEHGFIIGIASLMAPGSYHQGLPRMFQRPTFLDYPWPTFAKLGEQPVNKWELFASAANLTKADGEYPLFGYQSRYADWKQIMNTNHGEFHDTLLFWTLTRNFASSPTLGATFNYFDLTTQDRLFAVNGGEDNFWCYVNNSVRVRRCLPYFGTPNTLGFS